MKGANRFYIQVISPIHIGCDEVYEPTGFVLNEDARKMVVFDPLSFISQMKDSDKAEFSRICAKGTITSLLEVYKFMQHRSAEGRMIDVCPDFLRHYKQTLSIPRQNERAIQQNLNSFVIPRTAFQSVDQRPYIPGSAIKGALRTAYLNLMEREKKLSARGKERNARRLEERLMEYKGIRTDPFRMVKVSDFRPVGETRTRIIYGINKRKKTADRDARGLPLIFEVIQPGALFVGAISVDFPLPGSGIRKPVSMEKLLHSAKLFYAHEKEREERELANIGVEPLPDDKKFQDEKSSYWMRLGRHSGAESITIKGHRDIKIMMGRKERPKYLDHATTFWLASEERNPISMNKLQPFGWITLNRLTDDLSEEFQIKEQEWQKTEERHREIRQAEAKRKRELIRQAREEAKKREREEEEKRKEEERKQERLKVMTPEERDIMAISDPSVTENRVVEIYSRIDEFSAENKTSLALALKKYWQAHGKWEKKNCSKKQWLKVQKVKTVLGEQ